MGDPAVGPLGGRGDRVGISIEARVILGLAVVHPHLVAAGALRHDCDERRLVGLIRGPNPPAQRGSEPAVIVGRDRLRAVVVHRVIGQDGDRPARARLDRHHGEAGIDRAGRCDRLGVLVTGVHVGPNGLLAERVVDHLVRASDPSSAMGMLRIIDNTPTDSGRLEIAIGTLDRLGDPPREDLHVIGIGRGAQRAHRRGCRMSMRGGDQHPIGGDSGLLLRHGLGFVEQLARHHAAIDHHDRQPAGSIIEHQASGPDRVVHPRGLGLQEAAVDHHRELPRRDIDRSGAGAEDSLRVGRWLAFLRHRTRRRHGVRQGQTTGREDRRQDASHEGLGMWGSIGLDAQFP